MNINYFLFFILCFLIILFVGLYPKSFDFKNTMTINDSGQLVLSKGALAFFDVNRIVNPDSDLFYDGLSVEFILHPASNSGSSEDIMRLISSSDLINDVYVFQWRNKLISSFGMDYDYKKKYPRVSANVELASTKIKLLVLEGKMELYVDDVLVDTVIDSKVRWPTSYPFQVKVGGSSSIRHGWEGSISFLSVSLVSTVSNRSEQVAIYDSNRHGLPLASDVSVYSNDHFLPKYPVVYDRELFSFPSSFNVSFSFIYDVLINVIGFIPLGFCLIGLMLQKAKLNLKAFIGVVIFCFFISLFIEYVQSWMPGRESSLLDLLLNSSGSLLGGFLFLICHYYCKKFKN